MSKLTLVHGAPCSGKSTYVSREAAKGDIIYDFDEIVKTLTQDGRLHENNEELTSVALKLRSNIIQELITEKISGDVWIISTFLDNDLKKEIRPLNPVIIKMDTPIDECIRRLKENPDGREVRHTMSVIKKWFTKSTDNTDFYNSSEWKKARKLTLQRAKYLCEECKARGLKTEATQVHHVFTISERPDLKLNHNNLMALCEKHHLSFHNHLGSELSKEGKKAQRRIGLKYKLFKY